MTMMMATAEASSPGHLHHQLQDEEDEVGPNVAMERKLNYSPSIYISNLPVDVTKEKIGAHFSSITKEIVSIVVRSSADIQKSYAFINLKSSKLINDIISQYDKSLFEGQPIKVKLPAHCQNPKKSLSTASASKTIESNLNHNRGLQDPQDHCILEDRDRKICFTHLDRTDLTFYGIELCKMDVMQRIAEEIEEQAEVFRVRLNNPTSFQTQTVSATPVPGRIYAAQFSQDQAFYRATVLHNMTAVDEPNDENKEPSALVKFVDFGNTDVVPHSRMFELSKANTSIPPLCVHYKFKDLELAAANSESSGESELREQAADFIMQQLESDEIILSEVFVRECDKPLRHVTVQICSDEGCVRNLNEVLVGEKKFMREHIIKGESVAKSPDELDSAMYCNDQEGKRVHITHSQSKPSPNYEDGGVEDGSNANSKAVNGIMKKSTASLNCNFFDTDNSQNQWNDKQSLNLSNPFKDCTKNGKTTTKAKIKSTKSLPPFDHSNNRQPSTNGKSTNDNSSSNHNSMLSVPKSMYDNVLDEATALKKKIASLNSEKQNLLERVSQLDHANRISVDPSSVNFDALKELFDKVRTIESNGSIYTVSHANQLINIVKFVEKYTTLDIDEVETLFNEIHEKEQIFAASIKAIKSTQPPSSQQSCSEMIEKRNQLIRELVSLLKSFLDYVSTGSLDQLLETFDSHINNLIATFNANEASRSSSVEIDESRMRNVIAEIKASMKDSKRTFLSDKTHALLDQMKCHFKVLMDLEVDDAILSTFLNLKVSVMEDENVKRANSANNFSDKIESVALILLKSLRARKNLVQEIIAKQERACKSFEMLMKAVTLNPTTNEYEIKIPSLDQCKDISRKNRELIKNQLNPMLVEQSLAVCSTEDTTLSFGSDNATAGSEEIAIPAELFQIRNTIIDGLEEEDRMVAEIAQLSADYFPELCDNVLIRDFVKYSGLVKKRHFEYFNTRPVVEGKCWKIVSEISISDKNGASVGGEKREERHQKGSDKCKYIYRVMIDDNFTKSAEDYYSVSKLWNNVNNQCFSKMNYMFLDKMNFSLYYLVDSYSLTLADLIGNVNFTEVLYGVEIGKEEIESRQKDALNSLINAISEIHSMNLIHGEIKPSNISISTNSSRLFILSMPSLEFDTMRRIQKTKTFFSGLFGYSLHSTPNSHCFDISCLAFTFAVVVCDSPLPSKFKSDAKYKELPAFMQKLIDATQNFHVDIKSLMCV